jgi:hypothetical protein
MTDITPMAQRPRTIPLPTVAADQGISQNAVRRAIEADTAEQLPDDRRRIPGGRVEGATYWVIRRPYELVCGPIEEPEPTSLIRRRTA